MPEWLWTIIVGSVIMSLAGLVYRSMLTKAEHSKICHENTVELCQLIDKRFEELKTYLELKIKNEILQELKKLNGGGGHA